MSYATEKQRFQSIWQDALAQYTLRSGIDLGLCGSSAHSPESLLALLEQDLSKFNAFRDRKAKVWNATKPFLDVVQLFVEKADTASAFAPPPFDSVTKIILTAVGVLIQGAKDVSESYDQIVDLFETLNSTLVRFKTYLEDNITPPLRDVIVDALVQLLLILGITRKMTSKGRIRQFVKSVMGRNKDAKDAVANFEKILTRENLAVVASIYSDTRAIRNDTEAIREAIGVRRQGRDESRLAVKLCPAPTALFTGRQDVLRQMRSFFFDLPLDRHTFVLHGLGGAGKTQIACRFVTEAMKDGFLLPFS